MVAAGKNIHPEFNFKFEPPHFRPTRNIFTKIIKWIKKIIGDRAYWKPLLHLQSHNISMAALSTEEGKRELDRLVVLEAIAIARIHSATEMINAGKFEQLVTRAGLSIEGVGDETIQEIEQAVKDKNFASKLIDKCKSVANNKIKGAFKGWTGGDSEEED